jgi:hypothetical protein
MKYPGMFCEETASRHHGVGGGVWINTPLV